MSSEYSGDELILEWTSATVTRTAVMEHNYNVTDSLKSMPVAYCLQ